MTLGGGSNDIHGTPGAKLWHESRRAYLGIQRERRPLPNLPSFEAAPVSGRSELALLEPNCDEYSPA